MEIDLKKLNEDELIQICIDKEISYQNLKTKKPYAKTTLISYIKKFNNDNKKESEFIVVPVFLFQLSWKW